MVFKKFYDFIVSQNICMRLIIMYMWTIDDALCTQIMSRDFYL